MNLNIYKHIKIFGGLHIYFCSGKMRKRQARDGMKQTNPLRVEFKRIRKKKWADTGGRCEFCGQKIGVDIREVEMHHVLPYAKFPELINDERNLLMLCHHCHRELHKDPFKMAVDMVEKAQELGINIAETYPNSRILLNLVKN